jgi:hypothetical protein
MLGILFYTQVYDNVIADYNLYEVFKQGRDRCNTKLDFCAKMYHLELLSYTLRLPLIGSNKPAKTICPKIKSRNVELGLNLLRK